MSLSRVAAIGSILALGLLAIPRLHAKAGLAPADSRTFGNYVWTAPPQGSYSALGSISYLLGPGGRSIQLLWPAAYGQKDTFTVQEAKWSGSGFHSSLAVAAVSNGTTVHLSIEPVLSGSVLQAAIKADLPGIIALDFGGWPASLNASEIAVPYYSNITVGPQATVAWFPAEKLFANAWFDWKSTGASQLYGTQAQYFPLTNGKLLPVVEQLNVAVSPSIDEVFPSPGNPPSPELATMNGRMIVDIWGGGFDSIAQGLSTLGAYGVSGCLVIIHNWQHHGYDNALPDHYPANPELGGDAGLEAATAAARNIGCLVAVHENYIDYYPNYVHFTPAAIALNSDGSRQLAWLNTDTGIQSFATKPTWVLKNAWTESPVIHRRYGTTASFLDVNSGVPPGSLADMDATQQGAGKLTERENSSDGLWAYLRQTHQGPVVGEGGAHWVHSGLLDGVEAEVNANLGEAVPLFVDFDLLSIHPLQVNHGMGYVSRWTPETTGFTSTLERDAYRMQEIAFGHSPFLDDTDWSDGSRAMVESALVSPVAGRYGLVKANAIAYKFEGNLVDSSEAASAGAFRRVKVQYENGLTVTANAEKAPLANRGLTLPQFGWSATGAGVNAFTALCGASICDYAETANSIFANARNQSDIRIGSVALAGPSVSAFQQTGQRAFNITYGWKVYETTGLNLTTFVHFVNPSQETNEGIVFQGDHALATPTTQWQAGETITDGPVPVYVPHSVPDGTYSVRIGLFDPSTGFRVSLAGQNDGDERYILGSVSISQSGAKIVFTPAPPQPNDPRLNAAGSIATFPSVKTDGMFSLVEEKGNWVLRPFPRFRNFTVLIANARIAMPATVTAVGETTTSTITPVPQGEYWQLPLVGAVYYTWPVEP
jgi:hypothetical protein